MNGPISRALTMDEHRQDHVLLSEESYPTYVGFIAAAIAVFFFSSNFLPVKKFETGDGMFFQWILCSAIWTVGLLVHCIRHFPPFFPLAMVGGLLWSIGNLTVVPIIKTIGLSQGILIWATVNLLAGWASGRFGWFGLTAEIPHHVALNYVGVSLCVLGGFLYVFIKTETQTLVDQVPFSTVNGDQDRLIPYDQEENIAANEQVSIQSGNQMFLEKLSDRNKRILGVSMALVSGALYGLTFTPVIYIQNNYSNVSQNGLDYVFAHFCGIYLGSTAFFLIYCGWSGNKPTLYPRAILPGFISGAMWGTADVCWFIANSVLSEAISFPIISAAPALLAAIWGTVFFREIRGWKNFLILFCAGSITVAGTVITGFSKL